MNTANNRLNGYVFDNAGNTVRDPQSRRFTYDGENKQVKVETLDLNGNPVSTVGEYVFDGASKRIKKHVPSTGELTVFVYDAGGKLIGEYSTIAETQSPKVSYTTADHLGSPRILTDQNGVVISRRDFHPFGEEISTHERSAVHGYQPDAVRQKFTGYERDVESELDFAEARMYSNRLGRFTVPDIPLVDQFAANPQSWNLIIYVRNNPLVYIDPSGFMTDYVNSETGKVFTVVDDKDQVLAGTTALLDQVIDAYARGEQAYVAVRSAMESMSSSNLNLTTGEFLKLAKTLYAESSGGVDETAGIVDVLQNRAEKDQTALMDQVSNEPGKAVRGVKSDAFDKEKGPAADAKKGRINVGIVKGITEGDRTNGAFFWDGKDFDKNARGNNSGWRLRHQAGYLFTSSSHDLYGQKSYSKPGRGYYYESTAAIGSTTFSRRYGYSGGRNWR